MFKKMLSKSLAAFLAVLMVVSCAGLSGKQDGFPFPEVGEVQRRARSSLSAAKPRKRRRKRLRKTDPNWIRSRSCSPRIPTRSIPWCTPGLKPGRTT